MLAQGPMRSDSQSSGTDKAVTDLMRTAVAKYAKHDLEGAREAFLGAWKLKQHVAIAASLADVEVSLGRYRDAVEHLKFVLSQASAGDGDARADAEQQLAECMKHLGTFRVDIEPADARVLLDGKVVGRGPTLEIVVEPGVHALQAEQAGRFSSIQRPSISQAEILKARLEVAPLQSTADAPTRTRPVAASPHAERPSKEVEAGTDAKFWTLTAGGTLTAAALAVGVIYTVQSNSASSDADGLLADIQKQSEPTAIAGRNECTAMPRPTCCDNLASKLEDAKGARSIAVGSFVAGGVFGLATLGALVFWPKRPPPAASRSLTLSPWSDGYGRGLTVRGSF